MILITNDAYSKCIDALVVNTVIASVTIEYLRTLFATYGLPEVLVSDNDTQYLRAQSLKNSLERMVFNMFEYHHTIPHPKGWQKEWLKH